MSQYGQNRGPAGPGSSQSPYVNYAQNGQNQRQGQANPYQQYPYAQGQQPVYPGQQGAYPNQQQGYTYPQQGAYPNQQQGYTYPQQGAYPNQQQGYTYPQQGAYPNQQQGYTYPQQGAYPGQQPVYPGQQGAYPNQQQGYAYPQQGAYPNQQPVYPGQQQGYGQNGGYQQPQPQPGQNVRKEKKPSLMEKAGFAMEPDILVLFAGALAISVLFILSLVFPTNPMKWAFLSLALVGLAYIWVRPVLEAGAKMTATVLIGVACLITVLSMILTPVSDRQQTQQTPVQADSTAAEEAAPQEDPVSEENVVVSLEEVASLQQTGPTATPDNSATLENLSSFFFFWSVNKIDQMVNYCSPSWVKNQEDPKVTLFGILANRIMREYTIGTPSGTENDITRTVPVTARVDKNTGDSESIFIFNVIIIRENEGWYVDPQSLKSHEEVEATTFSVIITQPPTPQPAEASMTLYYNPDGGSYYHADPNCLSVAEKFRPLTGHFTFAQINEPAYADLKTCQRCAAPMR